MEVLSERIQSLTESATLAMSRKSRELIEAGENIINLSLGEPDFNTPDFIKNAAKQAIDDNFSHYPPVNGFTDLREAITTKFSRDNNLNFSPDQIVVSTGAKQSIANVVLSLINPGDEVLLPAPYWVSYFEIIRMAQGKPVIINTSAESDFKISPDQLKDSITSRTKLMIYSSPCNPTGSVYSTSELQGLANVIEQYPNVFVLSDEIYEHISFAGPHSSIGTCENIAKRVITVNGISKACAMTGWRIGYIGASLEIAKSCSKMQGQVTSGASGISQRAALTAVMADPKVTHTMRDAFKVRRDLILELLKEIPGMNTNLPQGAFYIFPEISSYFGKSAGVTTISTSNDLSMYLLKEAGVALVTGEAFGAPGYIRISYAASDDTLKNAVSRTAAALQKLH